MLIVHKSIYVRMIRHKKRLCVYLCSLFSFLYASHQINLSSKCCVCCAVLCRGFYARPLLVCFWKLTWRWTPVVESTQNINILENYAFECSENGKTHTGGLCVWAYLPMLQKPPREPKTKTSNIKDSMKGINDKQQRKFIKNAGSIYGRFLLLLPPHIHIDTQTRPRTFSTKNEEMTEKKRNDETGNDENVLKIR